MVINHSHAIIRRQQLAGTSSSAQSGDCMAFDVHLGMSSRGWTARACPQPPRPPSCHLPQSAPRCCDHPQACLHTKQIQRFEYLCSSCCGGRCDARKDPQRSTALRRRVACVSRPDWVPNLWRPGRAPGPGDCRAARSRDCPSRWCSSRLHRSQCSPRHPARLCERQVTGLWKASQNCACSSPMRSGMSIQGTQSSQIRRSGQQGAHLRSRA